MKTDHDNIDWQWVRGGRLPDLEDLATLILIAGEEKVRAFVIECKVPQIIAVLYNDDCEQVADYDREELREYLLDQFASGRGYSITPFPDLVNDLMDRAKDRAEWQREEWEDAQA